MSEPKLAKLLEVRDLVKAYHSGPRRLAVLSSLSFDVAKGELLAVVGRSGSGKTTLLNLIGGLDRPDAGSIIFGGQDLTGLNDSGWTQVRQHEIGFIFQFNQLLPEFSAIENTIIPGLIAGRSFSHCHAGARALLERIGLGDRLNHTPSQLSGGERQRVAIARALMNSPKLILADEPTGNLDSTSSDGIFALFRDLQDEFEVACILVTHNPELASRCDRILALDHTSERLVSSTTKGTAGHV